jgi:bifunctional enzyme CysN/CysC
MIAQPKTTADADQFRARIEWLCAQPLVGGRSYILKAGELEVRATITALRSREDRDGNFFPAKKISSGEIGITNIGTDRPIHLESSSEENIFFLLDPITRNILGKGQILFILYRATNLKWQPLVINKDARSAAKHQLPRCIWFTGLSGSGKSTIANILEQRLHSGGFHTYLLDGDNIRHGLNRDLGFTEADRVENIRRVAEVAKLMVDAGLIVLVSFISPFRSERKLARDLFSSGEFIEVYVSTDLEECEKRDTKGLYAKARRGELKNFTGIDSPYEPPENAELVVSTQHNSPEECVEMILKRL